MVPEALNNWVLLVECNEEQKLGGIILARVNESYLERMEVIDVNTDNNPLKLAAGNIVLAMKIRGHKFNTHERVIYAMDPEHIVARLV